MGTLGEEEIGREMNLEFRVYGWLGIHQLLQHQGLEEGCLEEICGDAAPLLGALAGQRPVVPPQLVPKK